MSTVRALNAGAHEANPLMKGAVSDQRVLVATKIGATFMSVLASEKLYRGDHRTAAIVVSVLTNSAMLAVANHNSQVLKRFQVQ